MDFWKESYKAIGGDSWRFLPVPTQYPNSSERACELALELRSSVQREAEGSCVCGGVSEKICLAAGGRSCMRLRKATSCQS